MFRNFSKYEIFEDGKVWNKSRKKWQTPKDKGNGYYQVQLTDNDGHRKPYALHRVVYEAVTGQPIPVGMQVNHIDENKANNAFYNLNLMTPKENVNWGTAIERMANAQRNHPLKSKKVGAFKDGQLVMTFSSTMEAQRNGYHSGAVSACCRGKFKTHKGYTWKYLN